MLESELLGALAQREQSLVAQYTLFNANNRYKINENHQFEQALIFAIEHGHDEFARTLLDYIFKRALIVAFDVNQVGVDSRGTALHAAALRGKLEIVTCLIHGFTDLQINKVDDDGDTALNLAYTGKEHLVRCRRQQAEIAPYLSVIQALEERGAMRLADDMDESSINRYCP